VAGTFTEDTVANVLNAAVVVKTKNILTSSSMITEYGILYVDNARGIVLVSYDASTQEETRTLLAGEKAKSATLRFVSGGKLYYSLSATGGFNLYAIDLASGAALPQSVKVTENVFANSWYAPELIGNNLFYASATDRTYKYVYVIDMTAFTAEDYEAKMIGKMNAADTATEEAAKAKDEENAQ
jgi:hypothetical protein